MKDTMMYGGMKWLTELAREMPSKDFTAAKTVVARNARGQVTGNTELKGGQQYPEGFGQAVADLYTRARTEKAPAQRHQPAGGAYSIPREGSRKS
jgi:hypothetical protein